MKIPRYWIGTVSKEHVEIGKVNGFAQVCHGKAAPLNRMHSGDILIYYSPKLIYSEKTPYQCFTALGIIANRPAYQVEIFPDFKPFRRDVKYLQTKDTSIRPLIPSLSFIKNKFSWGYHFRFGLFEINKEDALLIAQALEIEDKKIDEFFI